MNVAEMVFLGVLIALNVYIGTQAYATWRECKWLERELEARELEARELEAYVLRQLRRERQLRSEIAAKEVQP